jgi:hypothetical protein
MVAGMRSYLAASGLDVAYEVARASLVLSSDQSHMTGQSFDVARMMAKLEDAVNQALDDGYRGLWATGDMGWEFGSKPDFSKLIEYESQLEQFFRRHPALSGNCQYHSDTLPDTAMRQEVLMHPCIFVNQTLSRLNPYYMHNDSLASVLKNNPALELTVTNRIDWEEICFPILGRRIAPSVDGVRGYEFSQPLSGDCYPNIAGPDHARKRH